MNNAINDSGRLIPCLTIQGSQLIKTKKFGFKLKIYIY